MVTRLHHYPVCVITASYAPFFRAMSINAPQLKSLFETALNEFENRAGTNLLQHQIIGKLVNCHSADSVTEVLQEQAQALRIFRGDDGKLMKWLKRTVNVLYTLSASGVLGEAVGLVRVYSFLPGTGHVIHFPFSLSHQQKQSSPDSVYFLAYVSYPGPLETIFVTPMASIRLSKILARATMPWLIFLNLSNSFLGASTYIRRFHPPQL